MEAYTTFARVYDTFMDNVPYKEWADYLENTLKEYGIEEGTVLDLGCGTGSMTQELARRGYDMIGVDNAVDMLEIAAERKEESGLDILYLLQDMQDLELYSTVRAVVSVCDCVNYVVEEDELIRAFRQVNEYLAPGGIFLFDFNPEYKYRQMLADNTFAEDREDCSFIWENYYDEEERINEYALTLFLREGWENGEKASGEDAFAQGVRYRKYQEIHYQRAYTLEEMTEIVEASGLELVAVFDAYTKEEAREDSERITIIARETGKLYENI